MSGIENSLSYLGRMQAVAAQDRADRSAQYGDSAIQDSRCEIVQPVSLTSDLGEVAFQVTFPVTYVEEPHMNSGWRLGPNQSAQTGLYPSLSIGVYRYIETVRGGSQKYFTGADMICKIQGSPNARSFLLYLSFHGEALQDGGENKLRVGVI